ncbi:MAG: hypothetical protein ACE3JP_12340 [Ectobacillus sp.]
MESRKKNKKTDRDSPLYQPLGRYILFLIFYKPNENNDSRNNQENPKHLAKPEKHMVKHHFFPHHHSHGARRKPNHS